MTSLIPAVLPQLYCFMDPSHILKEEGLLLPLDVPHHSRLCTFKWTQCSWGSLPKTWASHAAYASVGRCLFSLSQILIVQWYSTWSTRRHLRGYEKTSYGVSKIEKKNYFSIYSE
jgi:hypothetical protein